MKSLFLVALSCCFVVCCPLAAQSPSQLDVLETLEVAPRSGVALTYSVDQSALREQWERGLEDHLLFSLPLKNEVREIEMQRVELFHPDFKVLNAQNEVMQLDQGLHYQATLRDTLVTLSVFPDRIIAHLNTAATSYTLAPMRSQKQLYRLSTNTSQASANPTCTTEDVVDRDLQRLMNKIDRSVKYRSFSFPALNIYFELDHFLYEEQGSSPEQCMVFLAGIFNSVAQLFRMEGIGLRVHQVKIWDQADPFATNNGRAALSSFRDYLSTEFTERPWDIEFLLSRYTNAEGRAPHGGLANTNSLCDIDKRQGYANISSWYADYPEYSWTVFVVAHEIGHTIASPHTHSCSWPEGPLDDCYCPEGSCEPGPSAAAQGGGTIMSYCYVQEPFSQYCETFPSGGNPGVNFLRAFGPSPGNLMRLRLRENACLQDREAEQLPNLMIDTIAQLRRVNDTVFVEGLRLRNAGSLASSTTHIGVFQGDNYLGGLPVSAMNEASSETFSFWFLLPQIDRDAQFFFQADILQEVSEWHEGDNLYATRLARVEEYAALNINWVATVEDKDNFFLFKDIQLQNLGWLRSGDIDLEYYLRPVSSVEGALIPLSQKSILALAPKEQFVFSIAAFEPALQAAPGDYHLIIYLEDNGKNWVFQWPEAIKLRGPFWEWYKK